MFKFAIMESRLFVEELRFEVHSIPGIVYFYHKHYNKTKLMHAFNYQHIKPYNQLHLVLKAVCCLYVGWFHFFPHLLSYRHMRRKI